MKTPFLISEMPKSFLCQLCGRCSYSCSSTLDGLLYRCSFYQIAGWIQSLPTIHVSLSDQTDNNVEFCHYGAWVKRGCPWDLRLTWLCNESLLTDHDSPYETNFYLVRVSLLLFFFFFLLTLFYLSATFLVDLCINYLTGRMWQSITLTQNPIHSLPGHRPNSSHVNLH